MSSPTSQVLSVLRNKQADPPASSSVHDLSRMKTVFIGRDQHPVTMMEMVPITATAWQKKACFDSLRSNARLLIDANHKSADVLNLVMQELPCSSSAAFQESDQVTAAARDAIFHVSNLEPEGALCSAGYLYLLQGSL